MTLAAVVIVPTVLFATTGGAQPSAEPPAFKGSAAASGVNVQLLVTNTTGFDPPMDSGGPTAQVAAESLGTSTGYAAFPNPGEFLVSVPGTISGLFADRGLPSLPSYPFYVQSDPVSAPDQSMGEGPYRLAAKSRPGSSSASASAGFASGAGNTGLVLSTAAIGPVEDRIVATATSDAQGVTVGPLTIGQVKTTATMTLDASGAASPNAALEITGLRIGGVPVGLRPDGLVTGSSPTPLPINDTLAGVLEGAGITVRLIPSQQFPDRVVAPAVEITMPFDTPAVPNVGQLTGTATITIGYAMASMTGMAGLGGTPEIGGADALDPGSGVPSESLVLGTTGAAMNETGGLTAADPAVTAVGELENLAAQGGGTVVNGWGVESLYLAIAAGAMFVVLAGHVVRRLGVTTWVIWSRG